MSDFINVLVNAGGLLFVAITGYYLITRIISPRFLSPWIGRKKRNEALERANALLESGELDEETEFQIRRCKNTLIAFSSRSGESWSGSIPISDVVAEVDKAWSRENSTDS